ncbi:MAG: serine/threonine-protein kinase [Myxococcota bacterium]
MARAKDGSSGEGRIEGGSPKTVQRSRRRRPKRAGDSEIRPVTIKDRPAEFTDTLLSDATEPDFLASEDPRIGVCLDGRYEIEQKLGRGGMGTVFSARHLLIGRKVAVKWLHPHLADDRDIVRRFHNEARAVSAIGHRGIVEALDMGRAPDGSMYVVFEFLEGEDLEERLSRGPMDVRDTLALAAAVVDALEAAHAEQIVHRDLKPANVFLCEDGGVKVLDFGVSKLMGGDARNQTVSGVTVGTPQYMSPEQVAGQAVDARSDVYSLGALLYRALSGRLPHEGASSAALAMRILTSEPPSLHKLQPEIPVDLSQAIQRLMAKRREDRPVTMAQVRALLNLAGVRDEGVIKPASTGHRARLAALGTAALLGVGVVGAWASGIFAAEPAPEAIENRPASPRPAPPPEEPEVVAGSAAVDGQRASANGGDQTSQETAPEAESQTSATTEAPLQPETIANEAPSPETRRRSRRQRTRTRRSEPTRESETASAGMAPADMDSESGLSTMRSAEREANVDDPAYIVNPFDLER